MYGGTRHSSAIAFCKCRPPEEIKHATMHSTNKAFERYFRMESDDLRAIYGDTTKNRGERPSNSERVRGMNDKLGHLNGPS
jgi:hypothetical protein